jgi:ribonuclease T1
LRGDCASDTDSGIFINGTVDVNSFKYKAANNSSLFTYTPEGGGIGTGVLQGPNLNGGFEAGSLAAGLFGPQGAKYWNPAAGTVNALGSLEMNIMASWAGALVGCTSGGSAGSCGANMAMALLPELKGIGLLAKEETAIAGVLKQIAQGTTKGKVFENFAGSLPAQASGYYREYTVPLAGQVGRGAARLVTGVGGEIYYTADHYATFTRIK